MYDKYKAILELSKYKLGIFKGINHEEELEYKVSYYQRKINEYEEGE